MIRTLFWYVLAALGEVGGCYCFWLWIRMGKPAILALVGLISLSLFALALTRIETDQAGRAFAAYGGVYILASVAWLWLVEGQRPDRWDLLGACVSLAGTILILFGPRGR